MGDNGEILGAEVAEAGVGFAEELALLDVVEADFEGDDLGAEHVDMVDDEVREVAVEGGDDEIAVEAGGVFGEEGRDGLGGGGAGATGRENYGEVALEIGEESGEFAVEGAGGGGAEVGLVLLGEGAGGGDAEVDVAGDGA